MNQRDHEYSHGPKKPRSRLNLDGDIRGLSPFEDAQDAMHISPSPRQRNTSLIPQPTQAPMTDLQQAQKTFEFKTESSDGGAEER